MYYLELIQRFWEFNKIVKISPTGISLYMYLLKMGYEHNHYDFKISDLELGRELGLTRVTIRSTKEKLKKLGLIQYQTGKGVPCSYRLLLYYSFDTGSKETEDIECSNDEILLQPTIIEATQKIEDQNNENKHIPSVEEFMEYAKTLANYGSQLDIGIREKYEGWIGKGWKNAFDRPISNWKATLKSALPYIQNSNSDPQVSLQDIPIIQRPELKIKND